MDNSTPQAVTLNMEAIRQSARQRFHAARKHKRSRRDWIEAAAPFGLLIILLAAFLLSAPHTAAIFNMITPGYGWAGVMFVEFGLLILAFRRRQDGRLPKMLRAFELLLFAASIMVNFAGALVAVVASAGIQALSGGAMAAAFGGLPVTAQVGLFLVPIASVLIPVGTVVTGEGFANLILQDKQADRDLEDQWEAVEQMEVYREAFSHLMHQGINPRDAQRRAGSATTNFYQSGLTIEIPTELASVEVSAPPARTISRTRQRALPKPTANKERRDVRSAVRQYLEQNPDAVSMSVRDLSKAVGVGKTVAGEELSAYKEQKGGVT